MDAFNLFLALLAPARHSTVVIPDIFAKPMGDAILECIDENFYYHEDDLYRVTGQINDVPLRAAVEGLAVPKKRLGGIKSLLEVIEENAHCYDPVAQCTTSMYFDRRSDGLMLSVVSEARKRHELFSRNAEYLGIKGRFPRIFARNLDPGNIAEILYNLGQGPRPTTEPQRLLHNT